MSLLSRASRLVLAAGPHWSHTASRVATARGRALSSVPYPSDRKYKSSHEWAKVDGDLATVGISDHAQAKLGEIVFVDLPEVGAAVTASESAAAVESVKAAADIYAPLSGEVVSVNQKLEDTPNLINSDSYEEGWMFQIKLSDPSELDNLLDSKAYEASIED